MLSIIIANFKNPPLLRLCLKSLAQNLTGELDYEIIVTDGSTSVETQNVVLEEYASRFRKIKVIPFTANVGYTRLVNEGIKNSAGDFVLILNPDIVILKNSIENMLEYLRLHPEIGLLGPRLLNFDDSVQQSCFRFYTPLTVLYRRIGHLPFAHRILNRFLMKDADLEKPAPVDWLMGSALMASRRAVERVGLMDETMFLYMSEVDWAWRFWENSYAVVYYPPARLYHFHKRESRGRFGVFDAVFKKETRWHIKDAVVYFRKHGAWKIPGPLHSGQPMLDIS